MVDILNIDDLATSDTKQLKLDGVVHKAAELSVQDYIDRVKRSRDLPEDASIDVKIAETVKLLASIFPSISEERFRKLPLTHLSKIVQFSLDPPEAIAAEAEKQAAAEEGTEKGNALKGGKKK